MVKIEQAAQVKSGQHIDISDQEGGIQPFDQRKRTRRAERAAKLMTASKDGKASTSSGLDISNL